MSNRRPLSFAAAVVVAAWLLVGCGDDGGSGLSAVAEQGREIARRSGCAACHGPDGSGAAGPSWVGLAGSTLELEDGTTLVADEAYLRRSITDPGAQVVAGYLAGMPENTLADTEVDAVVAYIQELG